MPVTAINMKVSIYSDHWMLWIEFTHPDQTKVSQIGLPVSKASCQFSKGGKMFFQVESKPDQTRIEQA